MAKTIYSPRFVKFNPYHAHSTGRFASSTGGGAVTTVTTIDGAIKLLGQGKGVMFTTPDKAVTLIHRMASIAQEARSKGEKAPVYDLCKVSVKGTNLFCSENVGIPRSNMPQLKGKPTPGTPADNLPKDAHGEVNLGPAFRDFMAAQGHQIEDIQIPASHLRASQTELNGVKVAGMVQSLEQGLMPPDSIFISKENYVIDGHHRWAANVGYGLGNKSDVAMPVARVDMPILESLKMAGNFAASMGIPQAGIGKAGLSAQEYMVAFLLIQFKFNPFHDRAGRFAAGTGLGLAMPGQGELPGMPQGLNPEAVRQPALFAPTGDSAYTELVPAPQAKSPYPDDIPVDKLADAELIPLGGDLEGGDNPRFKAEVDGVPYFVKSLESNILGLEASEQIDNELGARAAAKAVGLTAQTIPVDTFESGWTGTDCLAQPFVKRTSGLEKNIGLYPEGGSGRNGYDASEDIDFAVACIKNVDTPTLSKMIAYEYAMGTGDRHEGQYMFDPNAPKNTAIIMNDFGGGLDQGTYQQPSYLAKLADYTERKLNIKDMLDVASKSDEVAQSMQDKLVVDYKINNVTERLQQIDSVLSPIADRGTISVSDFEGFVAS